MTGSNVYNYNSRKIQVPSSPGFRLITPHLPFAGPGVFHSFSSFNCVIQPK